MKSVYIQVGGPLCKQFQRQAKTIPSVTLAKDVGKADYRVLEELPKENVSINTIVLCIPRLVESTKKRLPTVKCSDGAAVSAMTISDAVKLLVAVAA